MCEEERCSTATLDKGERSALPPDCFTSAGRILSNHSIEAWVASKSGVQERERERGGGRERRGEKILP